EPVHQARDAVRAEETHQVVFEREEELRAARIALTAGTAAQLAVDAPRLVALRTDDVQATRLHHLYFVAVRIAYHGGLRLAYAVAQLDVGTAAGHIRRDRDRALLARERDDLGFALVVLRVQH